MNVKFNQVSRAQFNKLSDRVWVKQNLKSKITIYYEGTNLYGTMIIDCVGDSKAYEEALEMAVEVFKEG